MSSFLFPSDILLPDFSRVDGEKWAVIACDQHTSEPEYWETFDAAVGAAPSVLRLILPEVWLSQADGRIPAIHATMGDYCQNVLQHHPNSLIYLERKQSDGRIRRGIVGTIDLEQYDFSRGSTSLIRATEGTVLERIPPRCAVRRGAALETPHVMLLIDDPKKTVVEAVAADSASFAPAYDFDLAAGGGHVTAKWIPAERFEALDAALRDLISPAAMREKYGRDDLSPLLFAVGDGNHSLATAKTCYEEIKAQIGDAALTHPARYAMCEVVNLHDEALDFEPIYRVVNGVNPRELLADFRKYANGLQGGAAVQRFTAVVGKNREEIAVDTPVLQLPVGTLQTFLDEWLPLHAEAAVDYIHGDDALCKLAEKENTVGFLFDGMRKEQLFSSVMQDGVLPRKTFSMGHAADKRYCLECKIIK